MILAREVQCGAGVADFVAVDQQTGQLVIIETKLARNGDRRRVVAQVLDYASDMFDQDLRYLEYRVPKDTWAALDDATRDVMADSLRSGDFRLVIVMDHVDSNLAKVARYFQTSGVRFSIELAEVSLAEIGSSRCVMTNSERVAPEDIEAARPDDDLTDWLAKTPRERQAVVSDLYTQGMTQQAIADLLGVSTATVSRWIRRR
jgi:CRP-like cAMP-binding protein